jgi:F0F1-type ATP synthase epsilon subunit
VLELFRLSVLMPGRTLLDVANVSKVRLKLADGAWLSIYPRHAPLLAETLAGPVTYTTATGDETETASSLSLSESILQVARNDVVLFTGGELTVSTALAGEEEDANAVHFDRLARVLMLSLQALPAETADEFDLREPTGE